MRQLKDFSDDRYKGACVHCGGSLTALDTNDDHVPSKVLLDRPLPANVHVVRTCVACNNGFSGDEEYFAAFLGAAMSGSVDPARQMFETAKKALEGNDRLRREIQASATETVGDDGSRNLTWMPDIDRIKRIVVKNARGHALYELGRPMLEEPDVVMITPLATIDEDRLAAFLEVDLGPGWPEVGSRLMQRLWAGDDMVQGWIIVQPEVYVFAVIDTDGVVVRSIVREYLLTEVVWND